MSYHQIFISYRRDGGDIPAKLVSEALKNRGYVTFYDYDALRGGTFDDRIRQEVIDCTDMILVLPPNALDRCQNENDWVRCEIALALEHGKNIIPVMLSDFEFPDRLPAEIDKVRYYNGVRFHMEFFDAVIDRIIEKLSTDPSAVPPEVTSTPRRQAPAREEKAHGHPVSEQTAANRAARREGLGACAAILLFVSLLLLGMSLFFFTTADTDLALICLLPSVVALYVAYICTALRSDVNMYQRLRNLLAVSAFLDVVMLILGIVIKPPYLLYCEAPFILFVSMLGGLFFLLRRSPKDSPYISEVIEIRKKGFVVLYSVFAVLAALITFLLVFTLGFYHKFN